MSDFKIPTGYALVPLEPTPNMERAASDAYLGSHGYGAAWIRAVFAAMLRAAPPQPLMHGAPESVRQPLTEDVISDIVDRLEESPTSLAHAKHDDIVLLVRAIELAHGIDSATAMKAAGARE
jgi:hypothetical protein